MPRAASSSRRSRSRAHGVAATETDGQPDAPGVELRRPSDVLERAGRIDEARDALERALAVWERKRCLPYVGRIREQIESLGQTQI